ncbi:MAG: zinc-dependent metalloprotease [Bacteroidota bacterium]
MKLSPILLFVFAFLFSSLNLLAQDSKAEKEKDEADKKEEKKKSPFKEYNKVITAEAVSDEGLFTVHRVAEKWYYEIPFATLGKELLLVSRLSKLPSNLSPYLNAGSKMNEQVVQWERKQNKVLLRTVSYQNIAEEESPIYLSVKNNNLQPIVQAFKIETFNEDSTALVIEVTSMFTKDVRAISGLSENLRKIYKVKNLDANRTFIDTIKSFPLNIEVKHTMTFNAGAPPSNSKTASMTLQMNQSMILLPEDKMQPRLYDERVGWFSVSQIDYNSEALKSDRKTYIRRWRLEPKDPEAYARGELVEPVKPIVYYLDPATPIKWRPYFKQGIEDWNECFEAAGFKNVISAKDPPTPEEDPEFSPEDIRYSVVRYVASTTRNAVGPSVSDPRTGEILESDIIWYHNHLRSYRNRYLLETGAANPSARTLNTPEAEIGEMMRRVISHEIGHALGLPHNMKASSAYPVDSLRSGAFTQKYGVATTIMDYARYNYVAQPGDENIRFIRSIGPYDIYSINWGYRYIPTAKSAAEEKPILNSWIKEHEGNPVYMFGSGYPRFDPDAQTENIGDDPVKASTYGIKNLKYVGENLMNWTTTVGEDYEDLAELYGEFLSVWNRYIGHVVTIVGGVHQTLKSSDQEGAVYSPVPKNEQQAALQFLNREVFQTPKWLMSETILSRIDYPAAVEQVRRLQVRHLNSLLDEGRMQRLIESDFLFEKPTYQLDDFLTDVRKMIWSEVYENSSIDINRRNLQRAYLEKVADLMTEKEVSNIRIFRGYRTRVDLSQSDIRPLLRANLQTLDQQLKKAAKRSKDRMTTIHLEDCRERIAEVLED